MKSTSKFSQKIIYKKISKGDKNYPKEFLNLKNKPKEIVISGSKKLLNYKKSVAIVGSRKMTSYGERVLELFVPQLVSSDYAIISGFMYGVDTYAHKLCVENGGRTIAVLGSGIKSIYPAENTELFTKIIKSNGLVISEYEPDQKPKPWMFAKRNRLIAALSDAVIIIEAGLKSGSLITANRAIELGKPVYAVPGQITSSVSKGTNELIATEKAKILTDISQILGSNSRIKADQKIIDFDNNLQKKIYDLLRNEDLTVDQIAAKLNKNAQEISSNLMEMDFSGIITEDRGLFRIV